MIRNGKNKEPITIKVGESTVTQEKTAKLLGIQIDDDQKWTTQITETGGVLPSLNSRLYLLKRLKNNINSERLRKVADSIWTSKLRYGLPLFGNIKWKDSDVQEKWLTDLQLHQNKMLRHLNGSKIADKISTKSILNKHNINSVNQMNALWFPS